MPLDDLIRAALREAARAQCYPKGRDALALLKQSLSENREDGKHG